MGEGRGSGKDEQSMAIGGGVAVGLIVFLCTIGIPMFIAGAVMVAVFESGTLFDVGIALLVIASVMTVIGIVFIILLCAGVIGKNTKTTPTTTIFVANGQQQQMQYATPYPGYVQQPGGHSQQPPMYAQPPPSYVQQPPPYTGSGPSHEPAPVPSQNELYGNKNAQQKV